MTVRAAITPLSFLDERNDDTVLRTTGETQRPWDRGARLTQRTGGRNRDKWRNQKNIQQERQAGSTGLRSVRPGTKTSESRSPFHQHQHTPTTVRSQHFLPRCNPSYEPNAPFFLPSSLKPAIQP